MACGEVRFVSLYHCLLVTNGLLVVMLFDAVMLLHQGLGGWGVGGREPASQA